MCIPWSGVSCAITYPKETLIPIKVSKAKLLHTILHFLSPSSSSCTFPLCSLTSQEVYLSHQVTQPHFFVISLSSILSTCPKFQTTSVYCCSPSQSPHNQHQLPFRLYHISHAHSYFLLHCISSGHKLSVLRQHLTLCVAKCLFPFHK